MASQDSGWRGQQQPTGEGMNIVHFHLGKGSLSWEKTPVLIFLLLGWGVVVVGGSVIDFFLSKCWGKTSKSSKGKKPKGEEKRKREIYDLQDPGFYCCRSIAHTGGSRYPGVLGSDLHAKAKWGSLAKLGGRDILLSCPCPLVIHAKALQHANGAYRLPNRHASWAEGGWWWASRGIISALRFPACFLFSTCQTRKRPPSCVDGSPVNAKQIGAAQRETHASPPHPKIIMEDLKKCMCLPFGFHRAP